MKLKKGWILAIVILLVAAAVSGSAWAYMIKRTQTEQNDFTPAMVRCELHEVKNANTTQKTSIKVENTGNVDAYLRVRLVSYWVDGTGAIVSKPSQMPTVTLGLGWRAGSNNTYYYQIPVAPGATTSEMLGSAITLTTADGYVQVVEVFAEAIQAQPTGAVTGSWGVSLNSSGHITAAP